MKKAIIMAALLLVGVSAFSLPVKSNLEFRKYLAKQIYMNTSYSFQGFEGTIKIRIDFNSSGITSVKVLSGTNIELNNELIKLVKDIPTIQISEYLENGITRVIIPIKFIVDEN
jgi:hypothetical protein